jgi:hypothetical protein
MTLLLRLVKVMVIPLLLNHIPLLDSFGKIAVD